LKTTFPSLVLTSILHLPWYWITNK